MPIAIRSLKPGQIDPAAVAARFPKISDGEIAFDTRDRVPEYVPFVVQVVERKGDTLTFEAINPNDGTVGSRQYAVNLTNIEHVWRRLPSTLDDPTNDPKNTFALLFLTETYLDQHTDENGIAVARKDDLIAARPSVLGPCTKWPCIKGIFALVKAENQKLTEENAKLKLEKEKLVSSYAKLESQWRVLRDEVTSRLEKLSAGEP